MVGNVVYWLVHGGYANMKTITTEQPLALTLRKAAGHRLVLVLWFGLATQIIANVMARRKTRILNCYDSCYDCQFYIVIP